MCFCSVFHATESTVLLNQSDDRGQRMQHVAQHAPGARASKRQVTLKMGFSTLKIIVAL